ncbi:amidohydrolase family protein [Paenibacillus mendelii]|uniref:Amidohydrolase family protein n=1 Tax=Paenibacillus mendelii TaxID=206163 RepID=A0ABV6JEC1_9BACL|nr:amidohydrolase family protein [Paenibacillus mendelii]MCQ6557124.1 amidohydrolase [Paenibacillus mendelii]
MTKQPINIIDCDVHNSLRSHMDLVPYMPDAMKRRLIESGTGALYSGYYSPVGVPRKDATPPGGGPAGSDPGFLVEQLIDQHRIDYCLLTGSMYDASSGHDADYAAAIISAYNDFMLDHWIGKHHSFKGTIAVSTLDPHLAAREIDRMGPHPDMVAVIMSSAARMPYGQRFYHPIYEAAERQGLPVMIHPGTEGAGSTNGPTAAGYPSYYLEWHTCLSQNFMAHLVSLVCEGVFEKYPNLKFVLVEGGVAWLPHLMWRLDKNYKALRAQVPWLKKLPSQYIREHCYLTTQPIEEPERPGDLITLFNMIDAENMLLFSSDYPHWDFDDPHAILKAMPAEMKRKIYYENAKQLFKL